MEVSIVDRNQFGAARFERLDPEFVAASLLAMEKRLTQIGAEELAAVAPVNDDTRYSPSSYTPDRQVEYLDLDSVQTDDGLALPDAMLFEELPSRAFHRVQRDDILLANVRPNRGAVAYVSERLHGSIASSGFSCLRPTDPSLAAFLFFFLRSHYGRDQLVRRARGSMYPAVLPRDVETVLVPIPSRAIRDQCLVAMVRCKEAWSEFFRAYEDAETALRNLLESIGAPPSLLETQRQDVDCRVIRKDNCFGDGSAHRIDAEFFREEYSVFAARALEFGAVPLGQLCDPDQGRATAGADQIPTFRQSSLTNFGINWSAVPLEPGSSARGAFVKEGDVLLAAMAHEAHYLARNADAVTGMPAELAAENQATHHLMRLRIRETQKDVISPSFLAVFLRSDTGRHQVQRCNRGLRGDHVRPDDLSKEVLVPIPEASWLKQFDAEIGRAERARRTAISASTAGVGKIEQWLDSRSHLAWSFS